MNLDPYGLAKYARKVYSQNQEDGITLELVRRLDPPRIFLEIGAGDGLENNTRLLQEAGWRGTWVDPALHEWQFGDFTKIPCKAMVEQPPRFTDPIGVFSLDIDGNDYHMWKAIGPGPAMCIIECNIERGLEEEFVMPYDPNYIAKAGDIDYGASVASMIALGRELGYTFVALEHINAFFVRDDLMPLVAS